MPSLDEKSTLPDATYKEDVDRLLDSLRQSLLSARPANVVAYLQQELKSSAFVLQAPPPAECHGIRPKYPESIGDRPLTVIVLGATGDLAKKKTFPALYKLFCEGLIPTTVNIVGYARSDVVDLPAFRQKFVPYFPKVVSSECHIAQFLNRITYVKGAYDDVADFRTLECAIRKVEGDAAKGNRLFYLALPPTAFVGACTGISQAAMVPEEHGWTRVIVEKPFGRDLQSSNVLSNQLGQLLKESQIFRIDHYLGKEMVQNIVTLRFANRAFSSLWNNHNIANVQITFKEKIGTEGRGGYFDNFGIIRDVIQNHLTQILALIGMEKPRTLNAEDIRDEKVALLRCVEPVKVSDCLIGQYTANDSMAGYLDDPTVPKGSNCPTFAVMKLKINNDRWNNVPFIIKAGKALESKAVRIRIQFHDEVRPFLNRAQRNELVICAQPNEAMYMKITTKTPGLGKELADTHQTELDLTYHSRYAALALPEAYESLISDAVNGNSTNFVRSDELEAAWAIFTPLLNSIDRGELRPIPYQAGSRGPQEADDFVAATGYMRTEGYQWESKI